MNEKQKQAIEKMYKKGLVNIQEIAEPMLERYDELDIQQCRFVIEYLLADRDFTEDYINDLEEEIDRLKDKLVIEYEAAQEGFMKKQIPTSVVDGTIVQELGWILNEIDKILKKAKSISYKVKQEEN